MISTWETQRRGKRRATDSGGPGGERPATMGRSAPSAGNVSDVERILSGVVGGILLSRLSIRSLPGAVTAVVGVGLVYQALSGHCPVYERLAKLHDDEAEEADVPASRHTEHPLPSASGVVHDFAHNIGNQTFDPAAEEAYWRENYATRPYYEKDVPFDDYAAAYRYGWESRPKHQDVSFHDVEPQLQLEWERSPNSRQMEWNRARLAALDAWDRADVNLLGES